MQSPSRSRRSAYRYPPPKQGRLLAVCYGWGVLVGATLTYLALAPITPAASSGQSIEPATADRPNPTESPNSAVATSTPSTLSSPPIGNGSQVTVCVKEQ